MIDPLDGTGNYAQGLPIVAVIVALVVKGETVAGWIYDPLSGAHGDCRQGRRRLYGQPPIAGGAPAENRS